MRLFIYCAGGLGRETLDFARYLNTLHNRWDSICFIDDVTDAKVLKGAGVFRYEALKNYPREACECIIASGEPYGREKIYQKLMSDRIALANLINPGAALSPDCSIGQGVMITGPACIDTDVCVEDNVLIAAAAILGHDAKIGKHTVLSANAFIGGETVIEKNVFIGPGALVKDRVRIGEGAIVSIGSVVCRNVRSERIVIGNPARVLGTNINHRVFGMFEKSSWQS